MNVSVQDDKAGCTAMLSAVLALDDEGAVTEVMPIKPFVIFKSQAKDTAKAKCVKENKTDDCRVTASKNG